MGGSGVSAVASMRRTTGTMDDPPGNVQLKRGSSGVMWGKRIANSVCPPEPNQTRSLSSRGSTAPIRASQYVVPTTNFGCGPKKFAETKKSSADAPGSPKSSKPLRTDCPNRAPGNPELSLYIEITGCVTPSEPRLCERRSHTGNCAANERLEFEGYFCHTCARSGRFERISRSEGVEKNNSRPRHGGSVIEVV